MSYRRAICEKEFDEIIHLGGKMRMWKSDFFFPITTMSLTCLKKIRCFFRTARSLTLAAQLVNHLPAMQETPVRFQGWEDPLEKGWATHSSILGLPWCSVSKEAPAVPETWVWSLNWEDSPEEDMATHSTILAGESPRTEKPRRPQCMTSQRVGYDWVTKHTCRKPAWGIPPVTRSCGGDLMGRVKSDLRFSPWHFLSMYPKR